jgi:periplasmic protein TonB
VKALPWIVSVLVHLALLLSGLFAVRKVEYGIEAGKNSVEVNLVAAAAAHAPAAPTPPVPEAPPVDEPDPDMAAAPPTPPTPVPPPPEPPQIVPPTPPTPKVVQHTPERGDSSSPDPGKDAVSAHSDPGAIMTAKPDYLSNPAPDYPEGCRRRKEEGLVVLDVIVGTGGRPESVSLHSSSGFTELDRSASTAVATWRFRPASLAGVKVRSHVVVPVRFRLDS